MPLLRMIPIAAYYLGATTSAPMAAPPFTRPQSMSQASLPRSPSSPAPDRDRAPVNNRASMPAPSRNTTTSPPGSSSNFVNQPPPSPETQARASYFGPTPEETSEETAAEEVQAERRSSLTSTESKRKSRSGTMNRQFKFPNTSTPDQALNKTPASPSASPEQQYTRPSGAKSPPAVIVPSNIEVPPPPPVEKEQSTSSVDEGEDDVGDTVDIPLN